MVKFIRDEMEEQLHGIVMDLKYRSPNNSLLITQRDTLIKLLKDTYGRDFTWLQKTNSFQRG